VEKRADLDLEDQAFNIRDFIRTLSYREFVTSLSLALLLQAIYTVTDYYANADWIETNGFAIRWLLF
jgi:hypothetical protein